MIGTDANAFADKNASIESRVLAWVVLLPTPEARAWEIVIRDAAAAIGLPVVVFNDAAAPPEVPSGDYVVLSVDPSLVARFSKAYGVIVCVGLDQRVGGLSGPEFTQALARTSGLLETASRLDALWLTERDAGRHDIELWPGFRIGAPLQAAPMEESARDAAVREALRLYQNPGEQDVRWSEELFLYDMRRVEQRSLISQMDIMGPARALVFGPYLLLPEGRWTAFVRFSFDAEAAKHRYRVEWGTTTNYASETVMPGNAGVFELKLDYEWSEAEEAEMRVILTQGTLGGCFNFLGMRVQRA